MGTCTSKEPVMDSHIRKTDDSNPSDTKKKQKKGADLRTFYTMGPEIGKGGFGTVNECTEKKTEEVFAVKILSKLKFAGEAERQNMKYETELMARVKGHQNVIELHETYEDRWNFYLVMEYAKGGELMDRILRDKKFSERTASHYFRSMAAAIQHCHKNHVVHRDLKPENFLFASDSEDAELKLTDFGLSHYIETMDSVIHDACGSAYYIAPEVFTRHYTRSADVWSLGVILYLLLSGTVPFGYDAEEEADVYTAIQTQSLKLDSAFASVSASARELVVGLLEKDPTKRYTIEQALNHPWVKGEGVSDKPLDRTIIQAMAGFTAQNRFKKQALKLIASTLSAADVAKLRAAFHEIDADQTGTISIEELANAVDKMGYKHANVTTLMSQMDADGDGHINYDEFLTATADRQLVNHQNNIWWAFCEYDHNQDGKISVKELQQIMGDSSDRVASYIADYDLDGDGMIDYEEFMRMVLPKDLKIKIQKYT